MKKKLIFYLLIPLSLCSIILISYLTYIAVMKPCEGEGWPMPPPTLYFGPYYIVTEQGPLYVGQTFEHKNEGPWVGNLTLLYLDNRGAIFLVRYPQGTGNNFKVMACKKYYPRTSANELRK